MVKDTRGRNSGGCQTTLLGIGAVIFALTKLTLMIWKGCK